LQFAAEARKENPVNTFASNGAKETSVMVRKLALAATLGWGLAGLAPTAALAGVSWTWNPAGASPALSGAAFTADNIIISDYATADINATTGNFTEAGVLIAENFKLGSNSITPAGFNTAYSLYATFTATGNQGGPFPTVGNSVTGPITSLSYTIYASQGGQVSVGLTGSNYGTSSGYTISGQVNPFPLVSGTLYGGSNFVTVTNLGGCSNGPLTCTYSPTANATTSQIAAAGEANFFVSPDASNLNFLLDNFSSNSGVTSLTLLGNGDIGMAIAGGGGNITSVVPEPTSVAVFAAGLLGLGWFGYRPRRRRG